MAENKSKAASAAEARIITAIEVQRTYRLLIEKLANVAFVAIVGYAMIQIARALAGQSTYAAFVMSLFSGSKTVGTVGFGTGIAGVWYGRAQHRLRRNVIEREHPRVVELDEEA